MSMMFAPITGNKCKFAVASALIFLLFSAPSWGANVYVNNSCTNNGDGTSATCAASPGAGGPYNSIANIPAGAYAAGNVIDGANQNYQETMTVRGSGTSANPLTIENFGIYTGWSPFFSATAETGDMSDWTSVSNYGASSVTPTAASLYHGNYGFDAESDGGNFAYASQTVAAPSDMWFWIPIFVPPSFSEAADYNYTYIFSASSAGTPKFQMYIQQVSTGNFQVHAQNNFGSFANIGTPNFTAGTWHIALVHYVVNASTGGFQFWWDGAIMGSVFGQNSSGTIDTLQLGLISGNFPTANSHLYFDNVMASASSMLTPNDGVIVNGKSYVTFTNVNVSHTMDTAYHISGASRYITIQNSTISDINANTYKNAVLLNGCSYCSVLNNTITNGYDGVSVSGYGTGIHNDYDTVSGNTVSNMGRHGIQMGPAGGNTAPTNTVIKFNNVSRAALWVDDSVGIMTDGAGAGVLVEYNVSFNHGTAVTRGEDYDPDLFSNGHVYAYNVGYGSTNGCLIASGSNNIFYGNTCYNNNSQGNIGNYTADGEISLYTNPYSITAKNNIFYASAGEPLVTVQNGATGLVLDNNIYYGGNATPFNWMGTSFGFTDYKTVSGQDANSKNANPLYVNPAANNFTLQNGSPAIGAGVKLGAAYLLNPSTPFYPFTLTTQCAKWNIGAFGQGHC